MSKWTPAEFQNPQLEQMILDLDVMLTKIKDKFPHLHVYAHIGDPNQASLELEYEEE